MMRTLFLAVSALIGALAGFTDVATAGAQSLCADLGGNVQAGNVCSAKLTTPAYTVNLRIGTDYPDDQAVTSYVSQKRDHVISAAGAPGARNLPYELYITTESYTSGQPQRSTVSTGNNMIPREPPHGTQSMVLKVYENVDGAPVGVRYKCFTYDFDQNRPVTFENLFAPGSNPMDAIYPAVAADLARQFYDRNFTLSPTVGRNPIHYQNFAITDDAVTFYFDVSEFLPFEAGAIYSTVARKNIPPLQL
jgi:hypothetical protein